MKRIFFFSLLIFLLAKTAVLTTGCANIIPPEGGPRDSLAPRLLKADPVDSSRSFTDNKVTFSFDEYVEVLNVQENLMISPLPKTNPVVDYKLRTVTLRLKDTLEANTTYTFNFGDAIRDFSEGNVIKNFTYTFSTGKYLDSLQLTGKVILAETGKADSTLLVMLHTSSNDSVVIKEKPRYITKLDGDGNFKFTNLPPKTFYLFALKDEGGTKRYLTDKQLFAFADKPVQPQEKNEAIVLYAYAKPTAKESGASAFQNIKPRPGNNATDKRLKFQTTVTSEEQDLLSEFSMSFEQPLRLFDSTRIKLYTDSIFTIANNYSFKKDSTNKKILLQNTWTENTQYHIILDKDFAEDSSGRKLLKTDTLSFKTKKKAAYGSLKLKIRNLDFTKNPVLIFLSNGTAINSYPLSGPDFAIPLFPPGEYELRILYDLNKNGSWDPGQFFIKHQQPEIAKPIERKITVKPGWQNDFEIAL